MSEIPYVPLTTKPTTFTENNGTFTGTGAGLTVPFTMLDISNERHFSYLKPNEHAFVSWLPLFDDCYYIFVCSGQLINDKNTGADKVIRLYNQFAPLTQPGDFTFRFSTVKKPFAVSKIKMTIPAYPFNTAFNESRTGKLEGINRIDQRDNGLLVSIDDQNGQFMSEQQADNLIRLNQRQIIGYDFGGIFHE